MNKCEIHNRELEQGLLHSNDKPKCRDCCMEQFQEAREFLILLKQNKGGQ